MKNLNLLFNKTYYAPLGPGSFSDDAVKAVNDELFHADFSHDRDYIQPGKMVQERFLLQTVYPGLLVGIGSSHNAGMSSEEIALGFSFDYVTGQPYIPGSSVKGVLRSHFKDHPQAVADITGRDLGWVKELEAEIFDGSDIFFDAVIYDSDEEGLLMGSEFITPHASPTENPVPIRLIKILPGVRLEFRFQLHNSPSMDAAGKQELLQTLLVLFGIGAKTNVGFGILTPDESDGMIRPKRKKATAAVVPVRSEPRKPAPQPQNDGAKCPHCGKWNFRYKRGTNEETWKWRKGICFQCGERLI